MKKIIAACAAVSVISAGSPAGAGNVGAKQAAVVVAQRGFQEKEFLPVRDALVSAGIGCVVVSSSTGEASGVAGTKAVCEKKIGDIKASDYAAVIFIGGPGAAVFFNDPAAQKLAVDTVSSGRLLGAICISPVILANAGVLKGRKATVFPGEEQYLLSGGAVYTGNSVEKDGKIITADGPASAQAFAQTIVKTLGDVP